MRVLSENNNKDCSKFCKTLFVTVPIQPENLRFGIALFTTGAPPDLEIIVDIARNEDLEIMYGYSAN